MNTDKIAKNEITEFQKLGQNILQSSKFTNLQKQIEELENQIQRENIDWQNLDSVEQNRQNSTKLSNLQKEMTKYLEFQTEMSNLDAAIEMEEKLEIEKSLRIGIKLANEIQNREFLNGIFDDKDVLMSIHAGAGGTDAQDWAGMLVHMYQAFAKKMNWDLEIVNLSSGEVGGIKSILMKISGENVYGILKEEAGVHRLVRISPFNAGKTRETSFALVEILPSGLEKQFEVKIDEKDLRWDYFMAGGKGGQSVNTTYSAVRLVHIPTGISISSQNQRSQLQNKGEAMKILQNRLAILNLRNQNEFKNELKGIFVSAEWGSQIRSYVLHPYKMVKDHRSNWETDNITNFLENGNILEAIWANKRKNAEK